MHVVGWDGVVGRQEGAKRGVQRCPEGFHGPKRVSTAFIGRTRRQGGEFPVNELLSCDSTEW